MIHFTGRLLYLDEFTSGISCHPHSNNSKQTGSKNLPKKCTVTRGNNCDKFLSSITLQIKSEVIHTKIAMPFILDVMRKPF